MLQKRERPNGIIPLNCVDKALLALDGKNERMVFHWILTIEGEIDPVKLNQALLSALHLHPRMRAIMRSRHFRYFRQIEEDFEGEILSVEDLVKLQNTGNLSDIQYEKCLFEWINKPLDIKRGFPFRVLLLRKRGAESSLIFTFHHSSADGLRAFRFTREVIERYNNGISGEPLLQDTSISHKGDELLELAQAQRSRVAHFHIRMISSLLHRLFIAPFPPPARIFHDKSGQSGEIHFCYGTVNPPELKQIESKSRSVGVTINDILLAACFSTIEKWNELHGKASKKISIMVPVNITPKAFQHIVSNQISFLSLSTMPQDRADPAKLLRKVSTNTTSMVKNRIAFSIIYFLYFCTLFPIPVMKAIAKFFMFTRVYVDTILLTNLGLIRAKGSGAEGGEIKIGSSKIGDITGATPVVTPMGMSIGAVIYNKNLTVSVAYKTSLFSKEKARMFLDLYLQELKNYQVGREES